MPQPTKPTWYDIWHSTTGKHIDKAEQDHQRGTYAPPANPHARRIYDNQIHELENPRNP